MGHKRFSSYEERFVRFSRPIERLFLWISIVLLLLSCITQALLQIPDVRSWVVETEALEGNPSSS
ncbi:hypothetical protein BSNK01_00750 [Bacillaceae bacterium]